MLKNFKWNIFKKKEEVTLFHVTHWKAGSQWIYHILKECFQDRIVPPTIENVDFFQKDIIPGKVYPTIYATYEQFHSVKLPENWKSFTIIRDIRDTLISKYFSTKNSHPVLNESVSERRMVLQNLDQESGILHTLRAQMKKIAAIQKSWVSSQQSIIRYEDLLTQDVDILFPILKLYNIPKNTLIHAIKNNQFEHHAQNRKPGEEDVHSHFRKGIAGDWKNYFTDKIKREVKNLYGDLLIETGYEKNHSW